MLLVTVNMKVLRPNGNASLLRIASQALFRRCGSQGLKHVDALACAGLTFARTHRASTQGIFLLGASRSRTRRLRALSGPGLQAREQARRYRRLRRLQDDLGQLLHTRRIGFLVRRFFVLL